ncbi:MAG TPA: tRNA pseudouridine(38-40) synthase TruA [Acidimicrobiales bacterium]|nr:tRNA pseudouridine(38-40) synthase TruA [Acidimicrobiales bacterium]
MTVAYDGTGFHGFAVQANRPDLRTVGGVMTEAIRTIVGAPVDLAVAGRTDRGVHAWGQVVTFDAPAAADLEALTRSLNKMLGPAIAVRDVGTAAGDFHARHSAIARRYRYTVLNRPAPDPFLARTAWWVEAPLDLRSMQLACDPLIGEHDYSSFCRKPPDEGHLVRRVHDARWLDLGDGLLRFDIEAKAFCHQMVRSVVGTLVAVGHGRRRAGELAGILRARNREGLPSPAPAHGLCLWEVVY